MEILPEQLGPSLRQGSLAVIVAQAASQFVSLLVLAAMYRLLGLEPYGLMGMVWPVMLLVRILVASGLDIATVQQAELSEEQVSGLFWFNQLLGIVMAGVTAASAPLVAWFYGVADLEGLTIAMAGTLLATALGTQHQALLQRKLRLGRLALARLAAQVLAGVAGVASAWAGWGVWALVVHHYVEPLALGGLVWVAEPWRPRWALPSASTRRLVRFGGYWTLSSLMFFMVGNLDKVLIGAVLGPAPLALYGQAFNLMMRPVHVVIGPVLGVMLPGLARAAADRTQYVRLLWAFFRFIGLVMFPCALGLAIVGPETMRVLGGPTWAPAGPILSVLALALLTQGFFNAFGSVLASVGRADRLALASAAVASVLAVAFWLGLDLGRRLGAPLMGMAASYVLSMVLIIFPPYVWWVFRTVGTRLSDGVRQLVPASKAAAGMAVAVAGCRFALVHGLAVSDAVLLAVEMGVGVGLYLALARHEVRYFLRQGLGWTGTGS